MWRCFNTDLFKTSKQMEMNLKCSMKKNVIYWLIHIHFQIQEIFPSIYYFLNWFLQSHTNEKNQFQWFWGHYKGLLNESNNSKTYQMTCPLHEDSLDSGLPIERRAKTQDAQTDLILRWVHVSFWRFCCATVQMIIWAASSEFGTYRLCEQRRFERFCAFAQSRQNLRFSLIQEVSQEEHSDRKPDPWPLWMAGHAQLKFVMTECLKTQIRLTRHIFVWLLMIPRNFCSSVPCW